jgi:hypothetical protein
MAEHSRPARYPVVLEVDHARRQSRWKAALRVPLSLPLLIFCVLLQGGLMFAVWAATAVRGRTPVWLFDFEVAASRWVARAAGYVLILTDDYPPFEGEHAVNYDVAYPGGVSRWKVLVWKLITAIPHLIILGLFGLSLLVAVPVSWVAVIVTGRYPVRLHGYVSGILRWAARVHAYVLSLTDELPPFSLLAEPEARWPYTDTIAAIMGFTLVGAVVGFFAVVAIVSPGNISAEVSYGRLLAGELDAGETLVQVDSREDSFDFSDTGTVELTAATDPADGLLPLLTAAPGHRLVAFELEVENESWTVLEIRDSYLGLKDRQGNKNRRLLVLVDGRPPPEDLDRGRSVSIIVFFEVPDDTAPAELRFRMNHHIHRTLTYRFT